MLIGKPDKIAIVSSKTDNVAWWITWAGAMATMAGLALSLASKVTWSFEGFANAMKEAADKK